MPASIKIVELRNLQIEDYKELKKSMFESYPEMAEMTLIVDVNIQDLKVLHEHGSVKTMKDRRHNLYSLKKLK